MANKTSKLSLKKETLRKLDSLTGEQLQAVGGGYVIVVPPSKTLSGGCIPTEGCLQNYELDYLKIYGY